MTGVVAMIVGCICIRAYHPPITRCTGGTRPQEQEDTTMSANCNWNTTMLVSWAAETKCRPRPLVSCQDPLQRARRNMSGRI